MPTQPRALLIEVMLHDDRWHGSGEWPPSPFRLFQALVAAAARGARLPEGDRQALEWLETLPPPRIAAPRSKPGRGVLSYVPNNDLDYAGRNPDRLEKIRVAKRTQPRLLLDPPHFLYVWSCQVGQGVHVSFRHLTNIVRRLHRFGRGVDMAWARAEVLTLEETEARLRTHAGVVQEPCRGGAKMLQVPVPGSLHSLQLRHEAFRDRLQASVQGRKVRLLFHQPPKPVSRRVGYRCLPRLLSFDIRCADEPERFAMVAQRHATGLVKTLRDMAAARLRQSGMQSATVDRYLVGRGARAQDKRLRVQIIPLPSIGHEHAGGAIRRLVVSVPQDCPLSAEDVAWAFDGLSWGELANDETGELAGGRILVLSSDDAMLRHYGIIALAGAGGGQDGALFHIWRTVTPMVLPVDRGGKTGRARLAREEHAARAVRTALRHAGIWTRPVRIRVGREPFDRNSLLAEAYDPDRFETRQLWHVEAVFEEALAGPLVVGNGRYLGLGVMNPAVQQNSMAKTSDLFADAWVFALPEDGLPAKQQDLLVRTARAALMALDGATHERNKSCPLFSGHPDAETAPLRQGHHAHVFLAAPPDANGRLRRLYVIAPWLADRSPAACREKTQNRRHFQRIVGRLQALYAPGLPRLPLTPLAMKEDDPLLGASRRWVTVTPYHTSRHFKGAERDHLDAFVREDVQRELARRNLPMMKVRMIQALERSGGALEAQLELKAHVTVQGPLILGQGSHRGLGCFIGADGRAVRPDSHDI